MNDLTQWNANLWQTCVVQNYTFRIHTHINYKKKKKKSNTLFSLLDLITLTTYFKDAVTHHKKSQSNLLNEL